MDAKTWFWTGALLNMALMAGFAIAGVRQARAGEVARHRRSMLAACALVLVFVGSYLVKLAVLGREDFSAWSPAAINTLRFHETCVLAMLLGGGVALQRARRMRHSRQVLGDPAAPPAPPRVLRAHRLAGRVAVVGALAGLVSAAFVLAGMIGRAGG
ncbi:MAG: DUF420 domain-containing protein [Myxococcota bacterium]